MCCFPCDEICAFSLFLISGPVLVCECLLLCVCVCVCVCVYVAQYLYVTHISLGDIHNLPTFWVLALLGTFYNFCFRVQTCRHLGGGYVYTF